MNKTEVKPCPFCKNNPEVYTIGEGLRFGQKGMEIARCITSGCAIWYVPISLDKWQQRAEE
jgi:hypothetical protein